MADLCPICAGARFVENITPEHMGVRRPSASDLRRGTVVPCWECNPDVVVTMTVEEAREAAAVLRGCLARNELQWVAVARRSLERLETGIAERRKGHEILTSEGYVRA